jgi:hypothetical protein
MHERGLLTALDDDRASRRTTVEDDIFSMQIYANKLLNHCEMTLNKNL